MLLGLTTKSWHLLLIVIVASIVVFDQVTKAIVQTMLPLHTSVTIIPGFLNFTHIHNTGMAFGFLDSADILFKPALMISIALGALIALLIFAIRKAIYEPLSQLALACVIGGAIGNLIDRVTAGYVIDFIDVYWLNWHFWAFNVADSAITVGAFFLILDMALKRDVSTTL